MIDIIKEQMKFYKKSIEKDKWQEYTKEMKFN